MKNLKIEFVKCQNKTLSGIDCYNDTIINARLNSLQVEIAWTY